MGHGHLVDLSVPGCLLRTGVKLKVAQYLEMRLSFASSPCPGEAGCGALGEWLEGGN